MKYACGMNKSIHKTHIHLIILQHYELFPCMALPWLEKKLGMNK